MVRSTQQHASQVGSIYGSITDLPDFAHSGGDYFASSMRIEQIR